MQNQCGPPLLTWSDASFWNFLKFYLNIEATLAKLSSYSEGLLQLSRGLRILASTPGSEEGYCRLKIGKVLYSAFAKDPSWMALMMFLVAWMLILWIKTLEYLADAVFSTGPPGVDKPNVSSMLFDFSGQQISVNLRLERHESLAKASRECRNGVLDSNFGSRDLGSIPRVEMVQSLCGSQLRNRRKHWESITSEENNILSMSSVSRNLSIGNEFKRIACSGIFSEMNIREVDIFSLLLEGNIF